MIQTILLFYNDKPRLEKSYSPIFCIIYIFEINFN